MSSPDSTENLFEEYAESYEEALARGLAVSGESAEFFAQQRVAWLRRLLAEIRFQPRHVLDFGCGTGTSIPHLLAIPGVARVYAADPSEKSLAVAQSMHDDDRVEWLSWRNLESLEDCDLVFTNGVLHHIPVSSREDVVRGIRRRLRVGGIFALWENNPWSPATRYVMSRIPFDKGARLAWPSRARRWLIASGFTPLRTDFCFIFPRFLSRLRPLESTLARLPLGAQYQILSRAEARRETDFGIPTLGSA